MCLFVISNATDVLVFSVLVSAVNHTFNYSLGKNIRSNVCLDILSYIHDIAIPTKDLGSGLQELQL